MGDLPDRAHPFCVPRPPRPDNGLIQTRTGVSSIRLTSGSNGDVHVVDGRATTALSAVILHRSLRKNEDVGEVFYR